MKRIASIIIAQLLATAPALDAQAPRYLALQLDCARYRVSAQATIQTLAGRERASESTGRLGVMVLRAAATPADSLLNLEAWFDTLTVFREGDGVRLEPETDGLVGGRFKAVLTPAGGATSTELPFLPEEIAQVTDFSGALVSLFPPLPPRTLLPGAGWRDDVGTVITRLGDMTVSGRRVQRYRLTRRSTRPVEQMLPDSTRVNATRSESEDGTYYWSAEVGLVRWERDLIDELIVEKGDAVKQPFRTKVEQKVATERIISGGTCT